MLAGDRSRGMISPASIVASLVISRIVCIGTYSILCASAAEAEESVLSEFKNFLFRLSEFLKFLVTEMYVKVF